MRDAGEVAWALDLDGVVWLDGVAVPGAPEAVIALRDAGERLAFVTNNAYRTRGETEQALERIGIDPGDDVITSAMAAATLVHPGERVLVCAGPGVLEALGEREVEVVEPGADVAVDAVVVGLHRGFDYRLLADASRAVRDGARFIATNTDATYPTPRGLEPGAGALVAAVRTAAARGPDTIAGKPHETIARLVRAHLGGDGVVVGDRLDTDGAFAQVLGYRFVLVLSGVVSEADRPFEPTPDRVASDLGAAVACELDATSS